MDRYDLKLKEKASSEHEELPLSLENKIELVLNSLPKKKKVNKKSLIAAAVACILIMTPIVAVYGKDIPIINSIIDFFKVIPDLKYSIEASKYEKYSKEIEKTITDNGISITIDNIACDDNFLVIFYTAYADGVTIDKFKDDTKSNDKYIWGRIKINGKERSILNNNKLYGYITDGKLKGMIRENIVGIKLPEKLKIDFLVDDVLGKKGKWKFSLETTKQEAMKDSKIIDINKEYYIKTKSSEHEIKIEQVSLTPFGNQIIISENFIKGNHIPFDHFVLYDDKGETLDVLNSGFTFSENSARNSFEFIKANKDTKSLTLVPIYPYSDTAKKEISLNPVIDVDKFPIEVKMSSKGSLVIDKIEFNDNDTKIYYKKKGVVLYTGTGGFRLLDQDEEENTDKNEWTYQDYIVDREKGLYVSILPKVNKNHKYKLECNTDEKFDLLDQYKIEIPLK